MSDETKPKLLLADDSATIRKVVELTFADEGIEVFAVGDAEAAMLKFVEVQPDIVLVDVGLTGTSGYRICEMIKQDDATQHIPVLLLVGAFEPFDQELAEKAECDGFLTKPFHSIRDLVGRVWELLGRERTPVSDTADIENLYESSFAETVEIDHYDTLEDLLGDNGMDDEMIEASHPAVPGNGEVVEFPRAEPVSFTSHEAVAAQPDPAAFSPKFIFDESPVEPQVKKSDEPSPEMISLIADRVVEKLSDRVVREIAREAVPRIAEKLIREALDEEKQN